MFIAFVIIFAQTHLLPSTHSFFSATADTAALMKQVQELAEALKKERQEKVSITAELLEVCARVFCTCVCIVFFEDLR